MTHQPLLHISDLGVTYALPGQRVAAVSDVTLYLRRGESLGLVGESGCGKTTLVQAVMRMLADNGRLAEGSRMTFDDVDLTTMPDEQFRREIRWKRIAMVFQSAMNSLNPVTQVGRQLRGLIELHDAARPGEAVDERVVELLGSVGLGPDVARLYPHELSGGMRQRAIIAMSLVADPELLIADEATTALDVVVQAQILTELTELRAARGLALLVVSHDIDVIAQTCDRVAVMYGGQIVETGVTAEVLARPSHPYTAALLASLPRLNGPRRRLHTLTGAPPELVEPRPAGCVFAPRCSITEDRCRTETPLAADQGAGRLTRCHLAFDARIDLARPGAQP